MLRELKVEVLLFFTLHETRETTHTVATITLSHYLMISQAI